MREGELRGLNGGFSDKFHVTGVKLLIHKDYRHLVHEPYFFSPSTDDDIINSRTSKVDNIPIVIGVVGGERSDEDSSGDRCPERNLQDADGTRTTTESAVQAIYGADIKVLALRAQAVNCLKDKKILAYSSDETLLKGMLREYSTDLVDYVIEPAITPLTYEEYGVVVYGQEGLKDSLIQRINLWSKELTDERFIENRLFKGNSLQTQNKLFLNPLQWITSFYRVTLPTLLMMSNSLVITLISFLTFLLFILFLTHRWIIVPVAQVFPPLFRLPIEFIEGLRRKGIDDDSKMLQLLTEWLRWPEGFLRQVYNTSRGIRKSTIDPYDAVQVLELLRNSRQEMKKSSFLSLIVVKQL